MKFKVFFIASLVVLLLLVPAVLAHADDEVPPEYAGLTSPFPWDDTEARETGREVYEASCLGCHGAAGSNIPASDFSSPDYAARLEEKADEAYWIFSEGAMSRGMPGYKSSISDEARWQTLIYIWSLGSGASTTDLISTGLPWTGDPGGAISLTIPAEARAGEPFAVSLILLDSGFDPFDNATVKFFARTNFFMDGWVELGEAVTDADGKATAQLSTRLSGDLEIAARYGVVESIKRITVAEPNGPFYQAEAGIHLPAPGPEIFIGPKSAVLPSETGEAPTSGFRLPGGILSWVLLLVAAVGLAWGTYLKVMYQVFRIPANSTSGEADTKLLPLVAMVGLAALGILLMLMLLTGPQSNFHLVR